MSSEVVGQQSEQEQMFEQEETRLKDTAAEHMWWSSPDMPDGR